MLYASTRNNYESVSSAQAIKLGMVPRGGLFVPEEIPRLSLEEICSLAGLGYPQLASYIIGLFLTDYTREELDGCTREAYGGENFSSPGVAPLVPLAGDIFIQELWHGPTAAFKDLALQIMPFFLSLALGKLGSPRDILILVATSGDTGKAALEGFKDVEKIKILVFYPHGGVSKVQELQMTTTGGGNTHAAALQGNFDDCQNAVKEVFMDEEFNRWLNREGWELSSANSINWGRLVPQVVYYFWAYLRLLDGKVIGPGDEINFCVPTGNFGNILAGYYSHAMGLPVHRFICASNENKILTDFINTGLYDMRREFIKTSSPSMDILISSNLERFLYIISGGDGERVRDWFSRLQSRGHFQVDPSTREKMQETMAGYHTSEQGTRDTIRGVYRRHRYLLDPHTAVGLGALEKYRRDRGDRRVTVLGATANPFKFNASVLEALQGNWEPGAKGIGDGEGAGTPGEFQVLEELQRLTGLDIHRGLRDLDQKPVRHRRVCQKAEIREVIKEIVKGG